MKQVFRFLLIITLSFALIACGDDEPDPNEQGLEDVIIPPIEGENPNKETVTTTKLVTYEGPSIMSSSDLATVKVNGTDLFVYETRVNHGRIFTFSEAKIKRVPVVIFDFEGKVSVSVEIKGKAITSAKVTPESYNIEPTINGSTITFDLSYPTTYTVEYNNQTEDVIHIFANPIEKDTPDPSNLPSNMIYIGPGVYKADAIPVKSNQTVYIAGGAVVYGQIRAGSVENVTLRGRGIISGEIYPRTKASEFTIPFEFRHSKNIKVEGITFLDSAGWTVNAYFLDGFQMDNVKVMTARANGDGISLQSCKNVVIKNCFVRSWDDSLVVKNYDRGSSSNLRFENITIWTDLAQSMEIGYECYGESITNVIFNNITILHNFHKAAISIHNADDAKISNIIFNNITIEDAQMNGDIAKENYDDFLIDFRILYNLEWTSSGSTRGTIENVTVNNVRVLNGKNDLNTQITGYDASHKIKNVKLYNINYLGKEVHAASDLKTNINEYSEDIKFGYEQATGAKVYEPYHLALVDQNVSKVNKPNITQVGLIIPSFSIGEVSKAYNGVEITGDFAINATHGPGTTIAFDDGSGPNETLNHPSTNLLDNNLSTAWEAKPWNKQVGEFASINITFDENKTIGMIRLYGDQDSMIFLQQNIAIYGIRASSTTGNYIKITNSDNYDFTPTSGNYADIKIIPDEFKAIQIRIFYKEGMTYPNVASLTEVEFYPASLTYGKAVSGTQHEDVYVINNITDGVPTTYYEAKKGVLPAEIIIDLSDVYNIKYINLHLPPLMQWEKRTQVISFYVSTDNVNYSMIIDKMSCVFDPLTGNVVEIVLDQPIPCKYLKLVVASNTASGGESAQLSEISVYE